MVILLFHVNRENYLIEKFIPRIPMLSVNEKEPKINRVCVSDTVDGCFSSVFIGGNQLQFTQYLNCFDNEGFNEEKDNGKYARFYIYVFDSNEVEDNNLLDYNCLYENKFVEDCLITREHWILNQEITPIEILQIEVHDFTTVIKEHLSFEDNSFKKIAYNEKIKGRIVKRLIRSDRGEFSECKSTTVSNCVFDDFSQKNTKNHIINLTRKYRVGFII